MRLLNPAPKGATISYHQNYTVSTWGRDTVRLISSHCNYSACKYVIHIYTVSNTVHLITVDKLMYFSCCSMHSKALMLKRVSTLWYLCNNC